MPIYEYRCLKCECSFEALLRNSHDGGAQCPHCGGAKLARQMSTFAARGSSGGAAAAAGAIASNGGCGMTGGGCGGGGGCGCH